MSTTGLVSCFDEEATGLEFFVVPLIEIPKNVDADCAHKMSIFF